MSSFTQHPLAVTPGYLLSSASKVGAGFLALVLVLIFIPWQQTADGEGRVAPFSPADREQRIDAPVGGRVARWFVVEGQLVEEGEPIVELVDMDPGYLDRLGEERAALQARLAAAKARVLALRDQVGAHDDARRTRVKAAEQQVEMAQQRIIAAEQRLAAATAAYDTQLAQLDRLSVLVGEGLVSQRDLELGTLQVAEARTAVTAAQAAVSEALAYRGGMRAEASRAGSEGSATVSSSEAQRTAADAEVASVQEALARMEVSVSRQRAQLVTAPRAGMVLALNHRVTAGVVKEGERLALLIPRDVEQAVELYVRGNDAPLVRPGRTVRLQFEGWPAIQFSGWPSIAIGTFAGEVRFVDALAQPDGSFRVVVVPTEEWPSRRLLRLGVRARGWLLLERVTLGFEVWRRINGFPPALHAGGDLGEVEEWPQP
jgi:membrane fusion protein, adhesin transport system